MKNAKALREERQAKIDAAKLITEKAKSENRSALTPEEKTQYDNLLR